MGKPVLSYEEWKARRPKAEAWAEKVRAALPTAGRDSPRDPEEARLLRRLGTPEHLIGPEGEPFWKSFYAKRRAEEEAEHE